MAEPTGSATGVAAARAALAGNPSDGYRGAVLAITLPALVASATVSDGASARSGSVAEEPPLVAATRARFAAEHDARAREVRVTWTTSVPRGVGLGGSSAIVIAVLRALGARFGVSWDPGELAALALSIEVDDLDIAAGLQDRVAQAHGGLTFMDFAVTPPRYVSLPAGRLPPLLVAWRTDSGGDSGRVHAPLRERHAAGEPGVRRGMEVLGAHARAAAAAVETGDRAALRAAVDGSFDTRAAMLELDPRHAAMITTARAGGGAANYAGSGGAILVVADDDPHRSALAAALRASGCATLLVEPAAARDLPSTA